MGVRKKFILNTGLVSVANIFVSLLSYVIIVMLSRELGAEGLGQYSFIFSFVGLFFIFSDWGLTPMMIKDLSKKFSKVNEYISSIVTFKILLGGVSVLVYIISLFFIQENQLFLALLLAGLIQFSNIFNNVAMSLLKVKMRAGTIASVLIAERVVAVIGAYITLVLHQDLTAFIVVLLIASLVRTTATFIATRTYFTYQLKLNKSLLGNLIRKGFPFLLVTTFTLVYVRIDTVMLSFIHGYEVVGWYNAGYKIIDVLAVVPSLLLTFGFPMLSRMFVNNSAAAKELFEEMIHYSALLVFPVVVGVHYVGERILEFVYGFSATQSQAAFEILIIALVFMYFTTLMGYLIASADKQHVFAWIAGIGAVLNIILNILLIPTYSLYGAAVATGITYVLMFCLMYRFIQKEFFTFKLKLALPTLASMLLAFMLPYILHLHLFAIVGISVSVYGVLVGGVLLRKVQYSS